jgi:hypothetical protein
MERHINSGSWIRRIKEKRMDWWHEIRKMDPALERKIVRARHKMKKPQEE